MNLIEMFAKVAEECEDMDVYVGGELDGAEINPMTLTPPEEVQEE